MNIKIIILMGLLSSIFGCKSTDTDFSQLVKDGAILVDVRTPEEFNEGHIDQATNIPLSDIKAGNFQLDKDKVIITHCRSGARSGQAKSVLEKQGYKVYNGGGWESLNKKLTP